MTEALTMPSSCAYLVQQTADEHQLALGGEFAQVPTGTKVEESEYFLHYMGAGSLLVAWKATAKVILIVMISFFH